MKKVLLINQKLTPHYRVPVYNYLSSYLKKRNYQLFVLSEGTQQGNSYEIEFAQKNIPLSFFRIAGLVRQLNPDAIIFWVNIKYIYLFPLLLYSKLLGKKIIYWGHGTDLSGGGPMKLKNWAYNIEFRLSDGIILYAEHLKKNLSANLYKKTFIANNTLNFNNYQPALQNKRTCLSKYKITTTKNIICVGRMQKRKRIHHLIEAFNLLKRDDVGLILVGPDDDGILKNISGRNIYKIPAIYGNERLDLLSTADIFCLPGAVGLSIVDAFYCELPIVTEEGDASPEMMYLKNGTNGFIVPRGDIVQLADKLSSLLDDKSLRERFSEAARSEIVTNGNMDLMCKGFIDALNHVCK